MFEALSGSPIYVMTDNIFLVLILVTRTRPYSFQLLQLFGHNCLKQDRYTMGDVYGAWSIKTQ